ncbi:hypothetical protein [Deinococcus humi]|uniref:Uncharacterized protein n=1 Tax=Deinococcus humi TaxID=662880 RepID=A0A7W8JY94_9DEIO|nr:hypothetical protein [Deinococcus humi]MBB5364158.1 hypothetical protein [Deinococcus humi]GGO38708.1 hypothetical protein GCM10008949_45710 [Deinococcus humi]
MEQEESWEAISTAEGRVYVLRVWRDGQEEAPSWHATVREGANGLRRSFASIDDCIEHLYGELLRR